MFRYGETLLDVLFVGGIISAGGAIEGNVRTDVSFLYILFFPKPKRIWLYCRGSVAYFVF